MRGTPSVGPHPDGYRAVWPGFPRAFALFSVEGSRIVVSDIFRDPNQPTKVVLVTCWRTHLQKWTHRDRL